MAPKDVSIVRSALHESAAVAAMAATFGSYSAVRWLVQGVTLRLECGRKVIHVCVDQ